MTITTPDDLLREADANYRGALHNWKKAVKPFRVRPWSRPWLLIQAALIAHIGTWIIVAIYYALFETTARMNSWWHSTVPNSALRHNIRDVAEGVLGALLAKAVVWNHFSKGHLKSGRMYDTLRTKTKLPEAPLAIVSSLVLFVILFTCGVWVLDHLIHIHRAAAPNGSFLNRASTTETGNWGKKVLGFVCAFAAVRPLHALFDDAQGYFANRRVAKGKKPHMWAPVTYKHRYAYLVANPAEVQQYSVAVDWVVRFAVLAGVGLAAWGYYILTYIA